MSRFQRCSRLLAVAVAVVAVLLPFAGESRAENGIEECFQSALEARIAALEAARQAPGGPRVLGRLVHDWTSLSADHDLEAARGSFDGGTAFRAARLGVAGTLHDNVDYRLDFDFVGGDVDFKDVFIEFKDVASVGTVLRLGHMKESFGLEESTSSLFFTMMERSLATRTFAPRRGTGFRLQRPSGNGRFWWGGSVFRAVDNYGDSVDSNARNFTGRLTGLPRRRASDDFVHLGLSYTHRRSGDGGVLFRACPAAYPMPRLADTGTMPANSADIVALEAAMVRGRASLQSEHFVASSDLETGVSARFSGSYVLASYFFTGEHRPYSASRANFTRVIPKVNAGSGRGGAWEAAVRFSRVDLDDPPATDNGAKVDETVVGLNWYLNPNSRIMWNLVREEVRTVGKARALMMRYQIDF